MTTSTSTTYTVTGMSCEHCERAVQAEVGALPAVESAAASAAAGTLLVVGTVSREQVSEAVQAAGYELG